MHLLLPTLCRICATTPPKPAHISPSFPEPAIPTVHFKMQNPSLLIFIFIFFERFICRPSVSCILSMLPSFYVKTTRRRFFSTPPSCIVDTFDAGVLPLAALRSRSFKPNRNREHFTSDHLSQSSPLAWMPSPISSLSYVP